MARLPDNQYENVVVGSRASRPGVTRDESTLNAARRAGASIETSSKGATNQQKAGTDHAKIAKLDRENEVAPPEKVAPSVGKAMQAARLALGLSQKDLATKTNEKVNLIGDYEASRAIPSPQILIKFERILGVKLTGAASGIGQPLPARGKNKEKDKPKK